MSCFVVIMRLGQKEITLLIRSSLMRWIALDNALHEGHKRRSFARAKTDESDSTAV